MTSFPVTMTRYRRHLVYLLGEPVLSDVSRGSTKLSRPEGQGLAWSCR